MAESLSERQMGMFKMQNIYTTYLFLVAVYRLWEQLNNIMPGQNGWLQFVHAHRKERNSFNNFKYGKWFSSGCGSGRNETEDGAKEMNGEMAIYCKGRQLINH